MNVQEEYELVNKKNKKVIDEYFEQKQFIFAIK